MTDISAGDLVVAIPIGDCRIGHPPWQAEFDNPNMTDHAYLVTWAGFSAYWGRPIVGVAGRQGHFCAGCFVKREQPGRQAGRRVARRLELVS